MKKTTNFLILLDVLGFFGNNERLLLQEQAEREQPLKIPVVRDERE